MRVKTLKITPKNRHSAIDISGRLYRSPSLLLKPQRIFHLVLTCREWFFNRRKTQSYHLSVL
ncbi:hypothetical protein EHJ10_10020 [Cronobacter dublinensis]|nr:hypothetical protein [Cronobacter dublinensis]